MGSDASRASPSWLHSSATAEAGAFHHAQLAAAINGVYRELFVFRRPGRSTAREAFTHRWPTPPGPCPNHPCSTSTSTPKHSGWLRIAVSHCRCHQGGHADASRHAPTLVTSVSQRDLVRRTGSGLGRGGGPASSNVVRSGVLITGRLVVTGTHHRRLRGATGPHDDHHGDGDQRYPGDDGNHRHRRVHTHKHTSDSAHSTKQCASLGFCDHSPFSPLFCRGWMRGGGTRCRHLVEDLVHTATTRSVDGWVTSLREGVRRRRCHVRVACVV
jgi:hypothetical protein